MTRVAATSAAERPPRAAHAALATDGARLGSGGNFDQPTTNRERHHEHERTRNQSHTARRHQATRASHRQRRGTVGHEPRRDGPQRRTERRARHTATRPDVARGCLAKGAVGTMGGTRDACDNCGSETWGEGHFAWQAVVPRVLGRPQARRGDAAHAAPARADCILASPRTRNATEAAFVQPARAGGSLARPAMDSENPPICAGRTGRSDESPPDGDDVFNAKELAFIEALAEGRRSEKRPTSRHPVHLGQKASKAPGCSGGDPRTCREAIQAAPFHFGQGAADAAKSLREIAGVRSGGRAARVGVPLDPGDRLARGRARRRPGTTRRN